MGEKTPKEDNFKTETKPVFRILKQGHIFHFDIIGIIKLIKIEISKFTCK